MFKSILAALAVVSLTVGAALAQGGGGGGDGGDGNDPFAELRAVKKAEAERRATEPPAPSATSVTTDVEGNTVTTAMFDRFRGTVTIADAAGNVVSQQVFNTGRNAGHEASWTDADGNTVRYDWEYNWPTDEGHNYVWVRDPDGNTITLTNIGPRPLFATSVTTDAEGNTVSTTRKKYRREVSMTVTDAAGNVVSQQGFEGGMKLEHQGSWTDSAGNTVSYAWGHWAFVGEGYHDVIVTDRDGNMISSTYVGPRPIVATSVTTDSQGNTVTTTRNHRREGSVTVTNAAGNVVSQETYSPGMKSWNEVSWADADGNTVTYSWGPHTLVPRGNYDVLVTGPDGKVISRTIEMTNGGPVSVANASGETTTVSTNVTGALADGIMGALEALGVDTTPARPEVSKPVGEPEASWRFHDALGAHARGEATLQDVENAYSDLRAARAAAGW